jgi:UDP-GlcNAc3NAcA epimerase
VKIVTVVGARPQFIKAAAVSALLRSLPGVTEVLVHTGQHYDENMSAVFFEELGLVSPEHHLGVGSGRHGAQTARMLEAIERVLLQEGPDWTLVYGDTNSTLAGALASAKLGIPVAHVEAGLRSFNRGMPEEVNRVLTDHAADLLLAPTDAARANLRAEGIPEVRIRLVGDVMYDAALHHARRSRRSDILERLDLRPGQYVVATVHRAENTDDPARLRAVFGGLAETARRWPVVLPIHPRTRAALVRTGVSAGGVRVLDPVGYLDMTRLLADAALVATDSGGVQKEAFFHRVPCVTLRGETEWVELIALGWNRLAPPWSSAEVARRIAEAMGSRGREAEPYGAGDAARRIADALGAIPR